MSTYQHTPVQSQPQNSSEPLTRPAALTAAVGAAVGAAVFNVISAVVMLTSMTELVRNQIAEHNSGGPVDPARVDLTSERAEGLKQIFSGLAGSMIFWAVVLALFALVALRGGRTTRILSAVILVVTALLKAADLTMSAPTLVFIVDALVVLLALAATVLFFSSASNAYGKQRRTQRRNAAA
jgi:hypothetical protein